MVSWCHILNILGILVKAYARCPSSLLGYACFHATPKDIRWDPCALIDDATFTVMVSCYLERFKSGRGVGRQRFVKYNCEGDLSVGFGLECSVGNSGIFVLLMDLQPSREFVERALLKTSAFV